MVLIREVVQCKPGKVRELVARFKEVGIIMERMGLKSFRLYTDLAGTPFWTLIAETEAESVDAFLKAEGQIMADPDAQKIMAGYHDLVAEGRREVYRVV